MDAKRELIRIINKTFIECLHEEFPNAKVEIEQHRIERIAQAIIEKLPELVEIDEKKISDLLYYAKYQKFKCWKCGKELELEDYHISYFCYKCKLRYGESQLLAHAICQANPIRVKEAKND